MGLPRSKSLNRWSEFQEVRRQGRREAGRSMVLGYRVLENDEPGYRVGFITPKRLGKAVLRNRIRRLLRNAVRLHPPREGHHYVLIARFPATRASYAQIEAEWIKLASRAELLASPTT